MDFTHAQRRDVIQGAFDYARLTSTFSRSRTQRRGLFFKCHYCSTDLDVLNYVSFVSHGRTRQSDSFNLRTPLCKTSTFQASYFNRIVKPWNYVCKLAPPTSFCSPNAFQLFVRKLMSTHLSRVYDLNYPCTWTLGQTCSCHS